MSEVIENIEEEIVEQVEENEELNGEEKVEEVEDIFNPEDLEFDDDSYGDYKELFGEVNEEDKAKYETLAEDFKGGNFQ